MVEYDARLAGEIDRIYLTPDMMRQRMRTLAALDLRAGERVLDAGCGTGLLAQSMADLVGPGGRVLGVDISPDMLSHAHARCDPLPQIELRQGSVEAIPAEDSSFDALACTQVLLYIADVTKTLTEIHRVLEPGGRAVIIETDWRGTILNSADDGLCRRILAAWDGAVASPNLPPRLGPMLAAAGLRVTRVEAIPIVNRDRTAGHFSVGMTEQFARFAQEHGAVTAAEAAAWLDDLARKGETGEYFFCINRFLFTAIRV